MERLDTDVDNMEVSLISEDATCVITSKSRESESCHSIANFMSTECPSSPHDLCTMNRVIESSSGNHLEICGSRTEAS
jgi:hypothetical protein